MELELIAKLHNSQNFQACPEPVQQIVEQLVKRLSENWDNWDREAEAAFIESLLLEVFGLPEDI